MEIINFKNSIEFVNLVKDFKGYGQISIDVTTKPKLTKKSRKDKTPFNKLFKGNVVCKSKKFASIGYEYEKSVNNRLEKEEKEQIFESQSLPWGEWVEGSKIIITHNDKYYLRISYLNANSKLNINEYQYENGEKLNEEERERLQEFLPVKKESNKKQGLENEIIINNMDINNIDSIRWDNKKYIRV